MSGRTNRWVALGLLAIGLAASIVLSSGGGYQVIEEMEQYINGEQVTVKGRIRWPQSVTIHVYIPNDPQGAGAEQEVQAACRAWEAKLRSETNANLTFEYHVGQSAPPMGPNDPPPYVIEVNWTDEETSGEPGTASPVSQVTQTGPNTYERGDTYRGIININRNQGPDQPYSGNAIYNIALHEFGHIFGLDHRTSDQDSVIMDDRGIDDPNKKHPIKDDDVRGLQDISGRNTSSTVPPKEDDEDEEDDETGEPSGTMCCAFECGGVFGCTMVNSEAECAAYNGVIQPGTCEATSEEEQAQGVYGRCNGSLDSLGSCCGSDLGGSQYIAVPGAVAPGEQGFFILSIRNDGSAPTWFSVSFPESPWLRDPVTEPSTGFAPGSEPFDAPPAVSTGCIEPGGEVTVTYTARVSEDAPAGEPVASTILLEDMLQRELYVLIATLEPSGATDCASDEDGDGRLPPPCGSDCDDARPDVYPGATEVCDGADNDCDGAIDEDDPGLGLPCDGPDGDLCEEGVTACIGGVIVCTDTTSKNAEVCNGVDDDCDGSIDEDIPGLGYPCDGPDGDLCEEGVAACSGGVVVCTDTTDTIVEDCANGIDDDCDGAIDCDDPDCGC